MLTDVTRHKEAERGNEDHGEGDAYTHGEHKEQGADYGQNACKELGKAHQ